MSRQHSQTNEDPPPPKRRRIMVISSDSESDDEAEAVIEEVEPEVHADKDGDVSSESQDLSQNVSGDTTTGNQDAVSVDPGLDADFLSALGEITEDTPKFGEKVHENLARLWLPILRKGLPNESKDNLVKQFLIPENCALLQAPKLNPEISAAVTEAARAKDKRVEAVQQQLGVGISAVNRGLALLLEGDKEPKKMQAIKHLSDSCRLLCDLHFIETEARKKMMTPCLDKSFLSVIQEVDRDETLFGTKLSEKIKASKVIEKQGLQIKKVHPAPKTTATSASASTSFNLRPRFPGNWGAPPRYPLNKGGRGGLNNPLPPPRRPPATQSRLNQIRNRAPTQH